ncbi:biogenesis of lysosome-related organelles complex 1 subunit 6 [Salminus brasiliensis]|uniref:biogenesis of lysosome-related organelles complex 1 subunit 6 n=1 Tax=Salminus brasiliensis TaxID=930266 RepID=UPI003B8342B2
MEHEAGDADWPLPQGAEPPANRERAEHDSEEAEVGSGSECQAGPVEDLVVVNEESVEKLTEGLITHYLPQLHTSKHALQELTQNQVILLETLDQEITKFRECNSMVDLNSLFTEAKLYHNKLVNIRKEMITLHDKTSKLKKRALKLQQQRQREALEREQQKERELERERQLIAKPAKRT